MALITVNFPSAEEEDLLRRFTVNRNYLQSTRLFLEDRYGGGNSLYRGLQQEIHSRPAWQRMNRGTADLERVRQFLFLGWTSEIQLYLPAIMGTSAIIGYSNTWAPVHAYYAVFGALQAWFAANRLHGVADDHTATLRTISNMIEQRDLFPPPWCLLATGCPMRGEKTHLNVPPGVVCTTHFEVLTIPVPFEEPRDFWPRYGTWLRSTRAARLQAREESWKKEHKLKRVSPAARTQIASSVAPTSFFDLLWRLRIKSNYGTIDPYLVSSISENDHRTFYGGLVTATRATMALLELYIARKIGKQDYLQLADDFVTSDSKGISRDTLQARLEAFSQRPRSA